MKKTIAMVSLTLVMNMVVFILWGKTANAQEEWPSTVPVDQLIIKYKADANLTEAAQAQADSQMERISAAAGMELTYFRPMSGDAHVIRLPEKISEERALEIAAEISALPEVEYAEPDSIMFPMGESGITPQATPNDPLYGSQWHYFAPTAGNYGVNAPAAWDITTGANNVYTAVLDTGIRPHTDLTGRWVGGYDMISHLYVANDGNGRDSDPRDPGDWVAANACGYTHNAKDSSWHGTHVAGTIGAASSNGKGVAGLNWVSQVVPVRVLGRCGGLTSDIADGIRWAAGLSVTGVPANTRPAKVINMSLGGSGSCSSTYQSAIDAAYNAGSAVIVSAGNSNANAGNYRPANCNHVITVAATDRNGNRAYYSNYGSTVEISAPGGAQSYANDPNGVLSTLNTGTRGPAADNYEYYQGTSMAAPHVAGVASLMYSLQPTLTPAEILSEMQNTVTAFPGGSTCNTSNCGSGIVNAATALRAVSGATSIVPAISQLLFAGSGTSSCPAIPNGNFESGAVSWVENSSFGFTLIDQWIAVTAHSGTWYAWLGGVVDEIAYIQQQVTVPSSCPNLVFYHWIDSTDICGYDYGFVRINGTIVSTIQLCSPNNTGGWVQRSINLSSYANQTVTLQIRAENDFSASSDWFIDDVAFQP